MAVQLGALVLDLVAQVGGFTQGMNTANNSARRAGSGISESMNGASNSVQGTINKVVSFGDSLKKIAGVAAIGAIGAKLIGMATASAEADLQLLILSDRVATSVENLQVFSKAASIYGVEMDSVGSILADFQEKLGEFTSMEGGGAADFFDVLKANTALTEVEIRKLAKTMEGLEGIEALQTMKNELDRVGASAQQQRFIFESLAGDLSNLMPLFENGGAIINEYGLALEEAGVIKSRQAVEEGAKLAAQQKALETRFEGVKNQLVTAFMPVLSGLMGNFLDLTRGGTEMAGVMQAIGVVAKVAAGAVLVLVGAVKVAVTIVSAFLNQVREMADIAGSIVMAEGAADKAKALWAGGKKLATNYGQAWKDVGKEVENTILSIDKLANTDFSKQEKLNDPLAKLYFNQAANVGKSAGSGIGTNTKQFEEAQKAKEAAEKKSANNSEKIADQARKTALELAKQKRDLEIEYKSEEEREAIKHNEKLFELEKHGLTKEAGLEKLYFETSISLRKKEIEAAIGDYTDAEETKLKRASEIEKLRVGLSKSYSDKEKTALFKSIDARYEYDLKKYREAQAKKKSEAEKYIKELKSSAELMRLERVLNPADFESASLYFERDSALEANDKELSDFKNNLEIEDVTERNKLIEEAQEAHRIKMAEINANFDEREKELAQLTLEEKLNSFSILFDGALGVLKGYVGESNGVYQALFGALKAYNTAVAAMNVWKAASDAYAGSLAPTVWGKAADAAVAVAQTSAFSTLIQGITPTGMAHNGIDNIPKEGTWLLDGGERVLNPNQNKDLTSYLNNQQNASSVAQSASPQNIKIINNLDPALVKGYMKTNEGEKLILNAIKSNSTEVRRMVGA